MWSVSVKSCTNETEKLRMLGVCHIVRPVMSSAACVCLVRMYLAKLGVICLVYALEITFRNGRT